MNPMNILKSMFGSMNPKEMVSKIISNNSNPIVGNLVNMANKGDTKGIEEFARNYMKEQGRNYDEEFNNFMNNFR